MIVLIAILVLAALAALALWLKKELEELRAASGQQLSVQLTERNADVDRRLAGKNKSIGNRERFMRRYKDHIKEAVKKAVDGRGIRDLERGEEIRIPKKDLSEPVFHHGQGGVREIVHPGNKEYIRGDRIERCRGILRP